AWGERLNIATVNGASAVVVSGEVDALTELMQRCAADNVRARRIDVDYASHSVQVDAIRDPLAEALNGLAPQSSSVAFFSTVTGELFDTAGLDGDYWFRSIRQTVQFERAIRSACDAGYRAFIESSPHPVLMAAIEETVPDSEQACVIPSLGRDDGGLDRFWLSVGQAFVAGVGVDWRAAFAGLGGRRIDLPTYGFVRQHFWLPGGSTGSYDVATLGLDGAEHGLLGAVVPRPDSGGVVLTGRLSTAAHPWLADHAVGGTVLFPGAGFVEMAVRAGDEVGCGVLEELTLSAPLVLPAADGVQVQLVVGAADESGQRRLSVYSTAAQPGSEWVLHAEGLLRPGAVTPGADLSVWPPVGATSVDVSGAYARLARRGYEYGRAFQGLRVMWQRGDELFAEIAVPDEATAAGGGFGIHPVLLDAALHSIGVAAEQDQTVLPFSWQGVSLHASGAARARVRIAPAGAGAVSVELADGAGLPVLSVGRLAMLPVSAGQLTAASAPAQRSLAQGLLDVTWSPISLGSDEGGGEATPWELVNHGGDVVKSVHAAATETLDVLQTWLRTDGAGVLAVQTRGAVALAGEDVSDLAGAAVWGLVRSAQAEHPGRMVLIDSDGSLDVQAVIPCGEPQVVVRRGVAYAARLRPVRADSAVRLPAGGWR
ncbi:acyltransferase domain-containing protein, partial [Mycobacterium sp.]|uniref:acyltransferase domain-containing protein n=1 Tax=Mycobacterium sp. TaxID=1785 RepID=UPI00262D17A3